MLLLISMLQKEITKVLKCKLFSASKQADDTVWIFRSLL